MSDVDWHPVGMISSEMQQAGLTAGEGCQWLLSVTYSYSNPDICWMGTDVGGIYRSTDGGESWHLINKTADNGVKGLDGVSGSSLMRCHPTTGELYTIGSCRGLWKLAPYVKK